MKMSKVLLAERAAIEYRAGKITISEAARKAEVTVWEMEKYFVDSGFKSIYSVEDQEKELQLLK